MNNSNAKLKLTFDSLDPGEKPSKRGFRCEPIVLSRVVSHSSKSYKHRLWSVEHSVGTCWKFIRKAIKFYEVFGGLNKYINSRDFSVLS